MSPEPDVATFAAGARVWLEEHRGEAPRDYGAILPPSLRDAAVAWQRALFDGGFAGITWPTDVGGRGLTGEHQVAWVTACAVAQVPPFLNMVGHVLAGGSIRAFGTPEQQREHLRPILTGDRVWCQLFSEPDAGSDLASLATSATLDGDHYRVTGQKVWCSNGRVADWGILMARTDPDAPRHRGISFFLLDMTLPGVETRPLRQMNGEAEFDVVFLTDVAVPVDCLVGEPGQGWLVAMATLTNERGYIGASGISLARRIDRLLADSFATDAVQRDRLAAAWSRGRTLWMTGRRQGPDAGILGSLTKLGTTELMFDLAELQTDLRGAEAMLDGPSSAQLTSAPGARIAGGTSQVQRNLIGERILGLPKGP